eukprot:350827-Alexandrium_andersonii.AAC.1
MINATLLSCSSEAAPRTAPMCSAGAALLSAGATQALLGEQLPWSWRSPRASGDSGGGRVVLQGQTPRKLQPE